MLYLSVFSVESLNFQTDMNAQSSLKNYNFCDSDNKVVELMKLSIWLSAWEVRDIRIYAYFTFTIGKMN